MRVFGQTCPRLRPSLDRWSSCSFIPCGFMMTSRNGNTFWEKNAPATGDFPSQRATNAKLWYFICHRRFRDVNVTSRKRVTGRLFYSIDKKSLNAQINGWMENIYFYSFIYNLMYIYMQHSYWVCLMGDIFTRTFLQRLLYAQTFYITHDVSEWLDITRIVQSVVFDDYVHCNRHQI